MSAFSIPSYAESSKNLVSKGNREYRRNNFTQAAGLYKKALDQSPNDPTINYNLAGVSYKIKDYDGAIKFSTKALEGGEEKLKEKAAYNLANAYYQKGLSQEEYELSKAIADVQSAITRYQETLKLNAKHQRALKNKSIAEKKLEELQKRLKDKEKKNSKDQKSSKQDKNKQDGQNENDRKQQSSDQQQKDQQQSGKQKDERDQPTENQQNDQNQDKEPGNQNQQQSEQMKTGENNKQPEQSQSGDNKKQQPSEKSSHNNVGQQDGQDSTQMEAKALLEDYQRNEEPKGLLNFVVKYKDEKPVQKDW